MRNRIRSKVYEEHRTNGFDGGPYWVCGHCHTPLPNGTTFEQEIWKNANIYCSKKCVIFATLERAK